MDLQPRHEAFCQAYADNPNGAAAARLAGYAADNANSQAARLLKRADVAARLAELRAAAARRRTQKADRLIAKLEPVYRASLDAEDYDCVLQVIELQARISGFIHGGASVRPRGRAAGEASAPSHEDFLDLIGEDAAA